ncbi:5-adenylylsulfate reductase chloroplastic-like [Quillaja saponaria]|uniref:5-adenylylsulfate reductase chloroplastic-like n=1 Tax=Quillaja saponaria TaxID=32244 RepID=A0AAD7KYC3_QUISA|nr:5-adenylylsulfate reductase chloroplastic-like [Quillaja saponaria]
MFLSAVCILSEYVKVDRQPCIGPVSINAWFLIHNEYIKEIVAPIVYDHKSGAAYDATVYQYFVSLAMNSIIHIMLFYASWCCFFQAMAAICAERAKKMVGRGLKVEKFTVYKHMAYAKHKALAAWHLEASSCTMPSFPRDCSMPMKWSTERMDTGSSKAFVKAIQ